MLQDHPWYMVVARPGGEPGSLERHPRVEDMACFEIPHGCYVKMECGTWHAGARGVPGRPMPADAAWPCPAATQQ